MYFVSFVFDGFVFTNKKAVLTMDSPLPSAGKTHLPCYPDATRRGHEGHGHGYCHHWESRFGIHKPKFTMPFVGWQVAHEPFKRISIWEMRGNPTSMKVKPAR